VNYLLQTLLDGLRAAVLRAPHGRALLGGAGLFVALVATYLAVSLVIDASEAAQPWRFNAGGVLVVLCDALLTYIAGWLLAYFAQRREVATGVACTLLAATIMVAVVIHWPLRHIGDALQAHDHGLLALCVALLGQTWWFFVLLVVAHWLMPHVFGRVVLASVLGYAVSAASWWWLPSAPTIGTADQPTVADIAAAIEQSGISAPSDDDTNSSDDETPAFDAEQAMYDQPALLDAELAKLAPRTPGKTNFYVVAFAGDGGEDVFRNEAEYAQQLFEQRFDARGHVVVLENNAATVTTRPLASWTNLHRTLDAIAKKMDPAQDIVLLYLTTHGSRDHELLVDLDPMPLNQIAPEDIADAFKTTPSMRWKVVVVNACYSGGFVDALRDDSTLVITSARADRTSFGCGTDSDITYFGKAFLVDALNRTTSLREAFDLARKSVAQWEDEDAKKDASVERSEPQIATSPSIEAKLARWSATLPQAPAVEFKPVAPALND
jgi:hypothetical protein